MENITSTSWVFGAIGFILGVLITLIARRFQKHSSIEEKFDKELHAAHKIISTQKQHLEVHFSESAQLMKSFAENYQKLHEHFAYASNQLLPDQKSLFEFDQDALHATKDKDPQLNSRPKDYTEGSSGLFKSQN